VAICLERDADLHIAKLMPVPLTVSCFSKIQIGFTFLVPTHPGSPGQRAVKRVCVCVYIYANYNINCPVTYYRLNIKHNVQYRTRWDWLGLYTHTHTRLTALFPDYPGEPVPERKNQPGFY